MFVSCENWAVFVRYALIDKDIQIIYDKSNITDIYQKSSDINVYQCFLGICS